MKIGDRPAERFTIRLNPVVRRELWLLPHSHNDIGYSDHQAVVEKNHWAFFEQAIAIAEKTAAYPEGARFKWNSEVLWAVGFLSPRASPEEKAAFVRAVKSGRIGLQGLYANVLTGIAPAEELDHFLDFCPAVLPSRRPDDRCGDAHRYPELFLEPGPCSGPKRDQVFLQRAKLHAPAAR
ncbi:MAG: hypothetical protein MZV63_46995 [Marinilabiliales bacterium]|nr:hypothetical protein [Marinilabiliales bacterium]